MSTLIHLNDRSGSVYVPADDTFNKHVQAVSNSVTFVDGEGKNPGEIKAGEKKTFKTAQYFRAEKPASIMVVEEQTKPVVVEKVVEVPSKKADKKADSKKDESKASKDADKDSARADAAAKDKVTVEPSKADKAVFKKGVSKDEPENPPNAPLRGRRGARDL